MRWLLVPLLVSQAAADPLPTIDSAFPPAIRVGGASSSAVKSVKIEHGEVTWVTIVVASDRSEHARDLTLDVPAGTHVAGMAVDEGSGPLWAHRLPRWDAASDYYHGQTPTLAEAAGSSEGEDHYAVRISDGGTFTFALCATCDGIDADTSLVLETNRQHRGVIVDSFPNAVMSPPDIDKAIIRRVVEFQMLQFRRCLMLVAQRDRVDGNVQLNFLITNGGTTETTIDTPPQLAPARECLADVVAKLEFPPTSTLTAVHYPLMFKLDR
jgi:hypothetical protein